MKGEFNQLPLLVLVIDLTKKKFGNFFLPSSTLKLDTVRERERERESYG